VKKAQEVYRISERRACRVFDQWRSVQQYAVKRYDPPALRKRLRELAMMRPRFGYRRLHVLLQREGWAVNHKRIRRMYIEEGLQVRVKRRKKRAAQMRFVPGARTKPNERWAMDFVADNLSTGHRIRALTVIDLFTRECLAIEVAASLRAPHVTAVLDRLVLKRGKPRMITTDNGSEFTSNHFDAWAFENGVKLDLIRPGRPVENGYVESFNDTLDYEQTS
jgi:putative transposase